VLHRSSEADASFGSRSRRDRHGGQPTRRAWRGVKLEDRRAEALCKRLREDAQRLREEKATLEGMIQSHDELILEMAKEYGLNRMGENDEDEDEDDDHEGNAVTPPALVPAAVPEEIVEEEDPVKNGPHELDDLDDLGDLDEDAENNRESNNQEANPLPPPPLTLEQVLAM
jgi:hypothetical protein